MIRFITIVLGGEAYLNFMGNEFGHPEWIDFPRAGNNWSYHYARRQWSLIKNDQLRYRYMADFDKAMLDFVKKYKILKASTPQELWIDESNNLLVFERGDMIFVFNFHPSNSLFDYQIQTHKIGQFELIFNSDAPYFGGFDRIRNAQANISKIVDGIKKNEHIRTQPQRTGLQKEILKIPKYFSIIGLSCPLTIRDHPGLIGTTDSIVAITF
jgi:1,4-alpha-glucan branching enzyme